MSVRDLDAVFRPRAIALVGASNTPGSVGAVLARNLMRGGFAGPVMPVNPRHRAIGGVLAWPDVASLPETPDLGVVSTPVDAVPRVVAELRERGARAAIIITAGFGEGADAAGQARRAAIIEAAGPMRIVGPNVVGVLSPAAGLNASFAHIDAPAGDLALVSQSGAILTSVLDWAAPRSIGFSHLVSLGDMADVDFGDMLDYLTLQPDVRAVLLYVEAITDARKFMSAARMAARAKPVVVIKAGRRASGARAAHSHTGALAGADAVYDAAFRRAGMLRVFDTEELFEAVETLAHAPRFEGDRLAILSNGGGVGVLAADRADDEGCRLARLSDETLTALDGLLPSTWSHGNPVDMIGDAPGERYAGALEALLGDDGVDAVLVLNCPTAVADSADAARAVLGCRTSRRFPVLTSWVGGSAAGPGRRLFAEQGVPTYETPEAAVRAFAHLVRYRRNQALLLETPSLDSSEHSVDETAAKKILDAAVRDGRDWLGQIESKKVLEAYGIPVVESRFAAGPEEAARIAAALPAPYALKVHSPDVLHKSDVGGVVLDLETPELVSAAAAAMAARIREAAPDARIEGFAIESMQRRPQAVELIVGLSEDPLFGPVVLFGQGGTAVEVIGDTAMALPPLNPVLARALVERTRIARLLRGYRDRPPADMDAIFDVLTRVARLAMDFDTVKELDINPLLADADGVMALDARIRVGAAAGPAGARLSISPYPRALEGGVRLRDGTEVRVRPVRPPDAPRLQEMIQRSDLRDIRMRFLHAMKRLPDQLAARLSQIDYTREMAFVAVAPGTRDLVGVSRLAADPDGHSAEYAVFVRSDWKGRGLGRALMDRIIGYAGERGLGELFGEVLAENEPMLRMCRELGFRIEHAPEPEIRKVVLAL
jgi:acetyltransferase